MNKNLNIMKNISIRSFLLIACVCIASGCDDFLDLKPKGKDVASKFEHYDGLLNNTLLHTHSYNRVTESGGTVSSSDPMWQYMSDEFLTVGTENNNLSLSQYKAFKWEDNMFLDDDHPVDWGGCYQKIYTYNVICNGVMDSPDGSAEEKLAVLSEARVRRAHQYMMLAQCFGKPYNDATADTDLCVPIVLEASTGNTSFQRATVRQVWNFIITEMEEACPNLKDRSTNRLRLFKVGGYMFLGKAYMEIGDYEKALGAFQKAETAMQNTNVSFGLTDYNTEMPKWKQNFMWSYGLALPSLWDEGNPESVHGFQLLLSNAGLFGRACVFIKPEYMALFSEGDTRRDFFQNSAFMSPTPYPGGNYRLNCKSTVYFGATMPDFYLLYAECLARSGNESKARELLTELRENRIAAEHAAIPASVNSRDALIRFIVEEHLREYMGTGIRWFNMRRLWHDPLFQDLKQNYTHSDGTNTYTLTENRLAYRVPPSILLFEPGWTDNP